ncbi:DUF3131 domain-containing protein [Paracoccus rhizosphaerae]|uniref:DUF3131 domain-containing protein n=1 Tax=Paracoccus rhizosphaerae TaxID=1133347 RepID=A0ABV6CHU8_9RHOB|nr:DUF3131 domain-containing protein [Paracoccus rhizosphaerae]
MTRSQFSSVIVAAAAVVLLMGQGAPTGQGEPSLFDQLFGADNAAPEAEGPTPEADDAPAAEVAENEPAPADDPAFAAHFGRHGPLTPREREMAETAWTYFENTYQEETGLVNAVGSYPSTTMWDTASYISGLVAAYELGIIDKRTFDLRVNQLIGTLRGLDLFQRELPNKVYNTQTGQKVNYANQPGEVGFSVLDIGRLLVWLKILKERYPYLAPGIDNTVLRWNFCNAITDDGRMRGSIVTGEGETRYVQEGRLGYEEYAAKGFALWDFDVSAALSPEPVTFTEIYDVRVPIDARDPRVFQNMNYVLTESYLLDGLELGWKLPGDRQAGRPGLATQGWRAEFANRIYLVQQRRFEQTGILTAKSEHQVEGQPFFVYDSIWANGFAWHTLDPSDVYQPDRAAIASKAAIGMWALWETPYTDLLLDAVGDLSADDGGFYEGLYENGNGYIPVQSANNNGIILAALLYKVQGPILHRLNNNTQLWDTAYQYQETRTNRCLPQPRPETVCCNCQALPVQPPVPVDEFLYCRPVPQADGTIAATECSLEEHDLPPPAPISARVSQCPVPGGP